MKKDPRIFLVHILESIQDIEDYTRRETWEKFCKDKKTQDAVMRKLEIIGEAVKKLPVLFKRKYSKVHWREIAGMRDILIHEYFGVNLKIVWRTIQRDIPFLKDKIVDLVKNLDERIPQMRLS